MSSICKFDPASKNFNLFFLLIIGFLGVFTQAQTPEEKNIISQFDVLIEDSNDFQEYKVVKKVELEQLKKATSARIALLKDSIAITNKLLLSKEKLINTLNTALTNTEKELEQTTDEKSSMQFMGIETSKSVYNIGVWSIICALVVILILFILRYNNSNETTRRSLKQLKAIEEELEELRRRSIEKEQKLGRQLQDERNKLARFKSDN
jgi:preprotein translocase subunit SecF